jgi:TolB-like protein/Tfp pilus assembly protein PilF
MKSVSAASRRPSAEWPAERWQQVKEIAADALEYDEPSTRTAFLERSCGGDTELMREIELLLAQETQGFDSCADYASRREEPILVGERLGAYRIVREIGRGGMGAVYLAERADGEFEKQVAIKLLKRGTDTNEVLRRFRAERRILARLDHPNIARLLDAGTTEDGLPFFVMEYLEGQPITDYARARQLPVSERLKLFLKVCGAVEAAHADKIIHRDLKPGNILVRSDGEPKLLDFGIAKLLGPADDAVLVTITEQRRLTPACASPEQARGEPVTAASDVYALGALFYELLTEKNPHHFSSSQPSSAEITRVVCEVEPVRPSLVVTDAARRREVRGDLETIALTALRKEPERRYKSVAALAEDIRRHLAGRPIAARGNTTSYIAARFFRRNYRRIAAALLLAGIGLLLGFLLFRSASQPRLRTQPIRAEDNPEQATHDADARRLFLQARTLVYEFGTGAKYQESLTTAVQLLENAVARDPKFSLAYSLLAEAHLYLYRDFEHADAHLHAAKEAADTAQRIAPESGAAHFAQAVYFYDGERDLPRAEIEITAALRALPTRADALEVATKVESRLGKWKEAIDHGEKAVEFDPRDPALIPALVQSYTALRRYADAERVIDRALGVLPPQFAAPLWRRKAGLALAQGNLEAARAALQSSPVNTPLEDYLRLQIAILARDFDGARTIADRIKVPALEPWLLFWRGLIGRGTGDVRARETFAAAATKIEAQLRDRPNDPDLLGCLALSEAGAGQKEKALQQVRRALELCPLTKDAIDGAKIAAIEAQVYAWLGQNDAAITKLATLVKIPSGPDYGHLALSPEWDGLRGDERFVQLLEQARRPIDTAPNGKEAATSPTLSVQEKSVAVLPFENVGDDAANAFFADGMQDEILNELAKVGELKVVSRRSVMQYRGTARNLKEIGEALQVAYVLEGAVQKIGSRIHVTARLVDTRTGGQVWAENYDRDVADVFAMQVELAEKIVLQLKVSLSPREKVAMAERTTNDVEAYDLYLRGKAWAEQYRVGKEGELEAEGFLDKAIQRDPTFVRAYCLLSTVELILYRYFDHSPARQAKAENAVQTALRLRPDLAEVRRAEAGYYYHIRDFEKARSALTIASQRQPNNTDVLLWSAAIDQRQGRWKEAVTELERALEHDPRNPEVLHDLVNTYKALRRYSDSERLIENGLAALPEEKLGFLDDKFGVAYALGDTKTCREIIESLPRGYNPGGHTSMIRFQVAFLDRDWDEAERVIDAAKKLAPEGFITPIPFLYGFMARAQGDQVKARSLFAQARKILEQTLIKRPDDAEPLMWIGLTDAALGRKEEAIREGREAVAKEPISRDASTGVEFETSLAQIYAWAGEKDLAIEQLFRVAKLPNGPTIGSLKLSADWDDVRGDPRFARIMEETARPIDLISDR